MISQIGLLWQSILTTGRPVFPYVGVVLFIVALVLVIALVAYCLYRLLRRLPIFFRHLAWRLVTFVRRLYGWMRRDRTIFPRGVSAAFFNDPSRCVPLQDLFLGDTKRRPWSTDVCRRPPDPVYVVIGPGGAGKSALLSSVAAPGGWSSTPDMSPQDAATPDATPDVLWWRLSHGWALEVNAALSMESDSKKFEGMLSILHNMCPERPIDGVVVVLPADILLDGTRGERVAKTMARSAIRMGAELGHAVPVHLVLSQSDKLRGFDRLVELRLPLGGEQAPLNVRLPSSGATPEPPQCVDLLRENVLNKALLTMAEQPEWRTNFQVRDVLNLPDELERMRAALQVFISQLVFSGSADKPRLRSMMLTGFSSIGAEKTTPRVVFAEQALRDSLFVRGAPFVPSQAYQAHLAKTKRHDRLIFGCFLVACLLVTAWAGSTWRRINLDVAVTERLLESLEPELRIARLSDGTSAASVSIASLEKLLNTTWRLATTSLTYGLVPTSWSGDIQAASLRSMGEIMNRTMVKPRSEQLANDTPRVSDEMLMPTMGVAIQRIDDLPAYIALVEFLDKREVLGASLDSGERLAKRVSYEEFLRFFGFKPEQVRLPRIDWKDSMPAIVSERFHVERLKTPEIEAAIRRAVELYWERILREAFEFHPIVLQSNDVIEAAQGLLGARSFGLPEAQQLGVSLKKLRLDVELPSSRRILGSKTEALSFFAKAQLRLGVSSVVSSGQVVELAAATEKRFELLRNQLVKGEVDGVGLLYTADAREGTLVLSQDIKRFATAYSSFLAQPFMRSSGRRTEVAIANGQYIEWIPQELSRVRGLSEAFLEYSNGAGYSFETRIKGTLLRLARSNYLALAESIFFAAAQVRDIAPVRVEPGLEGESGDLRKLSIRVANLSSAAKLYRLVQAQDLTQAESSPAADLLNREIVRLLEQIEANLYQEDPYMPLISGVSNWVRNAAPGKPLASDLRGDAKERLALLREYVRMQYSELVLPLLDGVSALKQKADADIVVRWMRLRDTIEGYEKGTSNNGIYEFERYVLAVAKLRDADECRRFIEERQLPVRRSDYFSRKFALMDESLVRACDRRILDWQRRQYQAFAGWFNETAAGRIPFSAANFQAGAPSLSAQSFMQILARYEEYRVKSPRGANDKLPWPDEVAGFLARMNQLSTHFIPLQPDLTLPAALTSGGAKPGGRTEPVRTDAVMRLRIGFRTNRAEEKGADQIIEWYVASAGRRYTANSKEPFEWRIGEPIEVGFRWAANSPVSPLISINGATSHSVSDRTAVFKYTGDWALFELLAKHATKSADSGDGKTLLFTVPTIGPEGRQNAQVFVTLMPSDGSLFLASAFPAKAPLLSQDWGGSP